MRRTVGRLLAAAAAFLLLGLAPTRADDTPYALTRDQYPPAIVEAIELEIARSDLELIDDRVFLIDGEPGYWVAMWRRQDGRSVGFYEIVPHEDGVLLEHTGKGFYATDALEFSDATGRDVLGDGSAVVVFDSSYEYFNGDVEEYVIVVRLGPNMHDLTDVVLARPVEIRDLDGAGAWEMIFDHGLWEDAFLECSDCGPRAVSIYAWNGTAFAPACSRFADFYERRNDAIRSALADGGGVPSFGDWMKAQYEVVFNMVQAGDVEAARTYIKMTLSDAKREGPGSPFWGRSLRPQRFFSTISLAYREFAELFDGIGQYADQDCLMDSDTGPVEAPGIADLAEVFLPRSVCQELAPNSWRCF